MEHRKPDFSRMSHRFGDYVLAITPADDRVDDLSPCADPAIILSRPFHGILVYTVYLMNTRVARRRSLQISRVTDSAINSINAISNVHVSVEENIESGTVPALDSDDNVDIELSET